MINIKEIHVIDDSDIIKGYLIDIENKKIICKGTLHGYKQDKTGYEIYVEGYTDGLSKSGANFFYDRKKITLYDFNKYIEKGGITLDSGLEF